MSMTIDDKTLEAVAKALFLHRMPSEVWPEFAGSLLRKSYMDDARAALDAAEACGYTRVPDGAVVAPEKPTEAMIEAGISPDEQFEREWTGKSGRRCLGDLIYATYRAMLAAAPAPPNRDGG